MGKVKEVDAGGARREVDEVGAEPRGDLVVQTGPGNMVVGSEVREDARAGRGFGLLDSHHATL